MSQTETSNAVAADERTETARAFVPTADHINSFAQLAEESPEHPAQYGLREAQRTGNHTLYGRRASRLAKTTEKRRELPKVVVSPK